MTKKDQMEAITGTDISSDIDKKFLLLIGNGQGVQEHVVTTGSGVPVRLLRDVDFVRPEITIYNDGGNTIYIGYNNSCNIPITVGNYKTLKWINPTKSQLCYNDQGNSGSIIDVIG
jgi:hypothetical protein